MPYRRLPNTDRTRVLALKSALNQAKKPVAGNLAFSLATLHKIKVVLPKLEQLMLDHQLAQKRQVESNKEYAAASKQFRLYLSHFMQVLNFSVIRKEIPKKALDILGLPSDDFKLPNLSSEKALLEWGEKVIQGEKKRMTQGQKAIQNPSIAMVGVYYDAFVKAHFKQKKLQESTARTQVNLANFRPQTDQLILKLWNEIEFHFGHIPDEHRREYCQQYGLKYVYRPHERKKAGNNAANFRGAYNATKATG